MIYLSAFINKKFKITLILKENFQKIHLFNFTNYTLLQKHIQTFLITLNDLYLYLGIHILLGFTNFHMTSWGDSQGSHLLLIFFIYNFSHSILWTVSWGIQVVKDSDLIPHALEWLKASRIVWNFSSESSLELWLSSLFSLTLYP